MKFDNCASCMLRDRPIVMEDYIDNGSDQTIMLVGEAPGYTEAKPVSHLQVNQAP